MARINIEDTLWKDNRFQELLIRVKDRHKAKGMILELWIVAQKYWLPSKGRGIPRPAWSSEGLAQELIDVGLARDDGEFIYALGSKEQFAWLNASSENGKIGGPAAAKARIEKKGKSKRRKSSENVENRQDTTSSSSSSSSSFSSSLSFSDSSSISDSKTGLREADASTPPNPNQLVWEAYREGYKARYGDEPVRNARVNSQIAQFTKRLPGDEAPSVARFYVSHSSQFYVSRMHPVGLMLQDAEKLRTEWATNRKMTRDEAKSAESRDFYTEQLKRLAGGGG